MIEADGNLPLSGSNVHFCIYGYSIYGYMMVGLHLL